MHHHVPALLLGQVAEVPEEPLQQGERRDGVVARGDRHDVARAAPVAQVALRDDQHRGVRVEVREHVLLEDEGVVAEVIGAEAAHAAHRPRLDALPAPRSQAAEARKQLLDRPLHSSSSSS